MDASLECTIRTAGELDESWSDYLGGLCVRAPGPGSQVCELSGRLLDQAALLGVLVTLYDLGLPLISVACREVRGSGGTNVLPQIASPRRRVQKGGQEVR